MTSKGCESECTVSTYSLLSLEPPAVGLSHEPVATSPADDQQRNDLLGHMTTTCFDTGLAGFALASLSRCCVLRLSADYLCICRDSAAA